MVHWSFCKIISRDRDGRFHTRPARSARVDMLHWLETGELAGWVYPASMGLADVVDDLLNGGAGLAPEQVDDSGL